jgi:hypothetical protein
MLRRKLDLPARIPCGVNPRWRQPGRSREKLLDLLLAQNLFQFGPNQS